ncbi:MAG: PrsW family intramembrane metalloprotease [Ignavibacteriales bacterium]|nr:PrsW family intramembrane metalloprotease [Ignavibacteriales bacterium]
MPYFLLTLAFAPGVALSLFVYCKDKFEKEPLILLLQCFFAGAVSVVPAILLPLVAENLGLGMSQSMISVALYAFFVIALSEEWSKYLFLRWMAYPKRDFNEPFDGIVYSVMISMGFATTENILYVMQGGLGVALLRMVMSVPAHATFAVLMGYFVGLSKFKGNQRQLRMYGLASAVGFHGAYDFFLLQQSYALLTVGALLSLLIAVFLSIRAMKSSQKLSRFSAS